MTHMDSFSLCSYLAGHWCPVLDSSPARVLTVVAKRVRDACCFSLFWTPSKTKTHDPERVAPTCRWSSMIFSVRSLRPPIQCPFTRQGCSTAFATSSEVASLIPSWARARSRPKPGSRCATFRSFLRHGTLPAPILYIRFAWITPHARLEMNAIFCALATRVNRFHVQQEARNLNNVLRGFGKLIVSVE